MSWLKSNFVKCQQLSWQLGLDCNHIQVPQLSAKGIKCFHFCNQSGISQRDQPLSRVQLVLNWLFWKKLEEKHELHLISISLSLYTFFWFLFCFVLFRRSLWEVKWSSGFSWGHITYYNLTASNRPWPNRTATNSLYFIFYIYIYITTEWGEVITIIWRLPIFHDQIDRPPILYLLHFIFYLSYIFI